MSTPANPILTSAPWRTSSYSNGNGGDCVEVTDLPGGGHGVRDSKNPTGPALTFTAAEWFAFTAGVRAGEFG
ncbi:MAG: DUF397 domain-containing protein [Pseudonocardiaceae bacterium]